MTTDLATLIIDGPIATLALNRPDARNALSIPMLKTMHARLGELEALDKDDRPLALIVTGEGRAFCAGMDLKAVLHEEGAPPRLLTSLADFTVRLRKLPQITIAKVNRAAIGGGCGLTCACDLSVTHADAKLGFPEVDLGVCPAVVAPWLVRKVGPGRARRVLLSGGTFDGARASELGIIDHVVPTLDDLDGAAADIAKRIASGGRTALAATKSLLNDLDGSGNLDEARRCATISADVLAREDARAMLTKVFAKA
ncbi:MAG: enoyl-CoA hydratase/isomerase family protein [Planctomycetota bacterium]